MATTRKKTAAHDTNPWETGALGLSEEHVRVATDAEMREVDDALELQMISIRLQKGLLEALKEIAGHHGIGYQPMIRDLLNRFARSEIRTILQDRLSSLDDKASSVPPMKPVDDFVERLKVA